MILKRCPRCKEELPIKRFSKRPNGSPVSFCKACQRANSKEHYAANKQKHNAKRYQRRKEERIKIKALLIELKSVPCKDCGESHPYWAMDFDHCRGEKLFNLGASVRLASIPKTLREIAKCDIVCALCHRYRTHGTKRGVA